MSFTNFSGIYLYFCLLHFIRAYSNDVLVSTKYGKLRGFRYELGKNEDANIFLNIPYAKPPVGELRFEKPQSPVPWHGIRDAKEFGLSCPPDGMRYAPNNISANSEDCLTLNIFAPGQKSNSRSGYPVAVFIHGGGYVISNAAEYGYQNISQNFVSQGIIVVTIQYRLGPFGFASLGDDVMPGNLGLFDMTQALKFISETIRNFGGNPKKITVWGQGSGGGSASMLALSPYSQKYVTGTIQQSGFPFAAWGGSDDLVVNETRKLVEAFNCSHSNAQLVKNCLKTKSLQEFFDVLDVTGLTRMTGSTNLIRYSPRIDGDFFPGPYAELYSRAPQKPGLQGINTHECLVYTYFAAEFSKLTPWGIPKRFWPAYSEANFTQFIRDTIIPEAYYGTLAENATQDLVEFYKKNMPPNADFNFWIEMYTQVLSDTVLNIPLLWEIEKKVENRWPTYLYLEEFFNDHLFDSLAPVPVKGSFHMNEYPYEFGQFPYGTFEFGEPEKKFQKVLIQMIVNFVKNQNPSSQNTRWPKLQKSCPFCHMKLNPNPIYTRKSLMSDQLKFYNDLTQKYPFNIVTHTLD